MVIKIFYVISDFLVEKSLNERICDSPHLVKAVSSVNLFETDGYGYLILPYYRRGTLLDLIMDRK